MRLIREQLDDTIAKVRAYRSPLANARNFLPGGESGMGKTTCLDWLLFNHGQVVEQERNRVPIIGIQAPVSQQTARPLLWRLVLECGHTFVTRDNEEILRYFAGALRPAVRRRTDRVFYERIVRKA